MRSKEQWEAQKKPALSTMQVLHTNGGQPMKTELAARYPNMPRRERRKLGRMLEKEVEKGSKEQSK